ncbi:MAG: hypothetical protein HPY62_09935 [Bacteroidales bacterium]|nr:hypothetical protein [Bacteroidales bacterium]
MKNLVVPVILLFLTSCNEQKDNSYFTPVKASAYFSKIETACRRDSGRLWGVDLYGPLMFIDRNSRRILANEPDAEGLLKLRDGIYTGSYPSERIISTTALIFGGKSFAMCPLPNAEDEFRIISRAIHALFHRYQLLSGINPQDFIAVNTDEKEARLWIKLEWKALRKALLSEGEEKTLAVRDALIFRGSNREQYKKYAFENNRFETYEGLSTFTGFVLASSGTDECKTRLIEHLDWMYSFQSFSRSYGAVTGALYAMLLAEKGFNFTTITSIDTDLGVLVKELYDIKLPEVCRDVAGSIALNYDLDAINREEEKRLEEIKERLNKQVSVFTEKPVLLLELESPSFDFEPQDVHSLDTLGTLYTALRVSDNWGKLTVDKGGCLISNNFKHIRLPGHGVKEEKNRISGDGWHIILNNGWILNKINDNYFVSRVEP